MRNLPDNYGLPLKQDIQQGLSMTLLLAALMGGMSLVGLVFPDWVYPSEDLVQAFLTNDLLNLIIGLPILLGPLWLIRQEVWIGLLCWPGAVLYVLYNSIAYLTGIPFGLVPLVHLLIVFLSAFIVYSFLRGIDGDALQAEFGGRVSETFGGWVLVVFGLIFIGRAAGAIVGMVSGASLASTPDLGVLIADLVLSTCWILGGASLIRGSSLGYASGLGLLFTGSMLFIGLIAFLILQPILTTAPFVLTDVLVVAIMGLICFIPFGLYARGVLNH